jgi:UDP-N-acetyl-D-mannosaminuronic acid dehydrogenase
MENITISVVGLGYIGLPTAAVFSSKKIKVVGLDVNQLVVDTINKGQIHIIEPDLDLLVHSSVRDGYLKATINPEPADAFLIAVPTPFADGHKPDLSYIESAAILISPVLKRGDLIILESTSPVGATEKMAEWLATARPDLTFPQQLGENSDIRIAYCPERVLPGDVLRELVRNDRIIGGMTLKCSEAAVRIYKIFVEANCIITSVRTAEMCKLTENSFRDTNIAFANELSILCDKFDINVWELINLANRHPRVNILSPGPGVGGHCIAVDPWFIVTAAPDEARLIRTAREVNDSKPLIVIEKFKSETEKYLKEHPSLCNKDIKVSCLGLAFKADIDDLRESPSLDITKEIAQIHPGELLVVEPNITELPAVLKHSAKLASLDEAISKSHIIILLVGHKEFKNIEPKDLTNIILIDTCGASQIIKASDDCKKEKS